MMITHLSVYALRNLSLEERERLGCVVLVMRGWPRGIRHRYAGRSIVDYWLKEAGPSHALLQAYQYGHSLSWEAVVEQYRLEQHEQTTCKNRSQGMRSYDNTCCQLSPRGSFPLFGGLERSTQGQWWQAPDHEEGPTSLQFRVSVWYAPWRGKS
jgi:uncharacterized protein YeaO (DUF488 family)